MKAVRGNEENKQRINLSYQAYMVLTQDYEQFRAVQSVSGFYNDIITRYMPQAKATNAVAMQVVKEEWNKILSLIQDSDLKAKILRKLEREYLLKRKLAVQKSPHGKGTSFTIRLNNENFQKLYGEDAAVEMAVYDRPSQYLKEILEEFARLPGSRREAFYLHELIGKLASEAHKQDFQQAGTISHHNLIGITLRERQYVVRPYKILADTEQAHLYLVGMSKNLYEPDTEERIVSFRLANLAASDVSIEVFQQKKALSRDEKLDIEERIRKNGVQYLVSQETERIKVRFHAGGEEMYRKKLHLRPVCVEKTEDNIYIFDCSERQAANYFFAFGRNVEILAPEKLRQDFLTGYQRAYNLYREGDQNG